MYDLEKRKVTDLFPAVENYDLAPDGAKLVVKTDDKTYQVVEPKEGLKPGDGKLDLSGLRVELDPQAEWRQIFRETWRLYRDFFYLPDMGKIDWDGIRKRYEPLVAHVSHRFDLTYVLSEVAAELGSGHAYVGGGDVPKVEKVPVGILGADLALDAKAGRWKVARILPGQNWNEARRSPLTEPGVNVKEGDYLLAIDGHDLTGEGRAVSAPGGELPRRVPLRPDAAHGHAPRQRTARRGRRPRSRREADRQRGGASLHQTGSRRTGRRSTPRRTDASATSTSRTWVATVSRSSSGSTTRSCARRRSSSTSAPTAAASSPR